MSTQTRTIRASCLHGIRDLRIEERELPPPGPNELQIAVHSTGICGSDQHYYHNFANGDILIREPLSLGHESSGVVTSIGSSVSTGSFNIGDRVALEVGLPCGECRRCSEGRYNICPKMSFRSSAKSFPHFQGTLQEAINAEARWCHKLPDNVSTETAALIEPLSVAIHGVRRAALSPGSTTLVIGAGAVGLLTAAMLRVTGSSKIIICDTKEALVEFAKKNEFADDGFVVPVRNSSNQTLKEKLEIAKETAAAAVREAGEQDFDGFDAVFECVGLETCTQTAIYAARPGGKVIMIGMGTPFQTIPISSAAVREVDLIPVFRYCNTYSYGISLMAGENKDSGRRCPDLSKLITHRFSGLESTPDAFKMAGSGKDENGNLVLKVVINNDKT